MLRIELLICHDSDTGTADRLSIRPALDAVPSAGLQSVAERLGGAESQEQIRRELFDDAPAELVSAHGSHVNDRTTVRNRSSWACLRSSSSATSPPTSA